MSDLHAKLDAFLIAAQAKVLADYPGEVGERAPVLSLEPGKHYIRIVATSTGPARSAFGFIDSTNGDVLKAAGWKAPAKNFARGNISDDKGGCGRVQWTGVA